MGREDADGRCSNSAVEMMGWKNRLRKSTRNTETVEKPKNKSKTVDKPKNKSKTVDKPKNKSKKGAISRSSDYSDTTCEECGQGEGADKMLLCDKCDKGYHMYCLCPIVVKVPAGKWFCDSCSHKDKVKEFPMVQTKIIDFFRIRRTSETDKSCDEFRKTKRRTTSLIITKKKRRLLPFVPTEDPARRLEQMRSLATALTSVGVEFSDELTYRPGMAPRSANKATMEKGGMQVMSKEDKAALELCKAMCRRGEWPPLSVVHDHREGFTVEADNNIKDLTIITEYTGDVDYLRKREKDDGDCMMTLLSTGDLSKDLVICPDKRGNIARFINGINNNTAKGKKKQNLKCVRYNVDEGIIGCGAWIKISDQERIHIYWNGGPGTNNKAEIMALWGGLLIATDYQIQVVCIYGDSQLVIGWMSNRFHMYNQLLQGWIDRTQRLWSRMDSSPMFHIFRENNTREDRLSKKGLSADFGSMYISHYADGRQTVESSIPFS